MYEVYREVYGDIIQLLRALECRELEVLLYMEMLSLACAVER